MTLVMPDFRAVLRWLTWIFAFAGTPLVMGVMCAAVLIEPKFGSLAPVIGVLFFLAILLQIVCLRNVWYSQYGWLGWFCAIVVGLIFALTFALTFAIVGWYILTLAGIVTFRM